MVNARAVELSETWTEEIRDVATLRAFLVQDRERAAFFLGDLDPRYFHATRWFVERSEEGIRALVLRYDGHSMPVVLLHGDADGVRRVLRTFRDRLPGRFDIHAFAEHRRIVDAEFPGTPLKEFYRLRMSGDDARMTGDRPPDVVRLGHGDTADLMRLYSRTGITYFDPYQLETGLYFGRRCDGELVSAAGVHSVSEEDRVAAVGNVATHPDYRGEGHSKRCMQRLLRALVRRRVTTIVLNVEKANSAAVSLYRSLGFRELTTLHIGRVG